MQFKWVEFFFRDFAGFHQNLSGEVNLTLPVDAGRSGEVLTSVGNGELQWADPASRANSLDRNSNDIADNAENSELLSGRSLDYLTNLDNMVSGANHKVFTAEMKT